MASDSCWTHNDVQVVSAVKIKRLSSGALLGQAGDNDARAMEQLLDKVRVSRQLPTRRDLLDTGTDFNGLLVLPNGSVYMIASRENEEDFKEEVGLWECNRGLAAVGSGSDFALGAMDHGASAAEAVRIACRWDINSRLPVHTVALRDKPKGKR